MHLRHLNYIFLPPRVPQDLFATQDMSSFQSSLYQTPTFMEWVWIATLYNVKCFNPPITKKKNPNSSDYIHPCQKTEIYICSKYLSRTSPKNRIPCEITIPASSRSRTYSRLSRRKNPHQTSPARTPSSSYRYKQPQAIPHELSSLQSTSPIFLCHKFPHLHVWDTNTRLHGPINRNHCYIRWFKLRLIQQQLFDITLSHRRTPPLE